MKQITATFLLFLLLLELIGGIIFLPALVNAQSHEIPFLTTIVAELKALNVLESVVSSNTGIIAQNTTTEEVREWDERGENIFATAGRYAAYVAYTQLLDILTEKIIAWINGEDGSRQKILDWESTLDQVADQAGGAFINSLAGMNLCNFSPNLNIPALVQDKSFRARAQCSFTDIQATLTNVRGEIENGDWTNWIRLGQSPQNNPYALLLMAEEEKLNEKTRRKESAKNEALTGGGFLSVRKCTDLSGQDVTASVGDMTREQVQEAQYTCEVVTPSGIVQGVANKAALAGFDRLNNSVSAMVANLGVAGPFVVAITNALVNRIVTFGFTKAVSALTPDPSSPEGQKFFGHSRPSLDSYNQKNPSYSYFLTCDPGADSNCDQTLPGVLEGLGLQSEYNLKTEAMLARSQATVDLQNYLAKIDQLIDVPSGVLSFAKDKQTMLKESADALAGNDLDTLDARKNAANGLLIILDRTVFYELERGIAGDLFSKLDSNRAYTLKTGETGMLDTNGIPGIQANAEDPALDTDGDSIADAPPDLTELAYVKTLKDRITTASALFDFYNGKLTGSPSVYDVALADSEPAPGGDGVPDRLIDMASSFIPPASAL